MHNLLNYIPPAYSVTTLPFEHGSITADNDYVFDKFMLKFNNKLLAFYVPTYNLTILSADHGTLSANKMSGFLGDVVTVDSITDEGWYLSAIALTGAEATGFKFMFTGSDVTAQGEYTDVGFPITYLADEHVSCTGDTTIYTPGGTGIALQTGYDTYYRISGYDVINGTVENGVLYPTGPCTVRAVATLNTFTASGGFEKGSNVTALARYGYNEGDATIGAKYATTSYCTPNVPADWYSTSSRWNVTTNIASGYQITLNPEMTVTGNGNDSRSRYYFTGCSLIGGTSTQLQAHDRAGNGDMLYSASFTSDTTGVNYGISGHIHVWAAGGDAYVGYVATATTGTWVATGILP